MAYAHKILASPEFIIRLGQPRRAPRSDDEEDPPLLPGFVAGGLGAANATRVTCMAATLSAVVVDLGRPPIFHSQYLLGTSARRTPHDGQRTMTPVDWHGEALFSVKETALAMHSSHTGLSQL